MVFLLPARYSDEQEQYASGQRLAAGISSRFIALYYVKESYRQLYFLFLPQEEGVASVTAQTAKVTCCLENIDDELHHSIDTHSNTILSRHIELLLDYCSRYYERQFITRENKNKMILGKMEGYWTIYHFRKVAGGEAAHFRMLCRKTESFDGLL